MYTLCSPVIQAVTAVVVARVRAETRVGPSFQQGPKYTHSVLVLADIATAYTL